MADQNQEVAVKITGDGASAAAAMKQASDAVTSGVDKMKSSLSQVGDAFSKVTGVLLAMTAVVAGGKFFKDAIAESNKLTGETLKLSKTLGITAEQANTLNTALGDIGSDADTYTGAFQRFAQQLRRNEEGMKDMGIQTRDSSGNLRNANDVMTEALQAVSAYKPGLDQTTAAQKLFGKSIDDVIKLQKLNNEVLEEARRKNEELGLVITDQNVEASKAYKAAMNDVGDVLTAVNKVVGDAVMPIFTELANYFASTGPYVVAIFKGALTGLMLVFRTLQAVVKTVASVIFEFINATIDQVSSLGELIGAVLSGDFDRAGRAAEAMKDRVVSSFRNIKEAASDAFTSAQESFGGDLDRLWGPKAASSKSPGKGTKTMGEFKDGKDDGKEKNLTKIDAALAAAKLQYAMENDLREMSKAQELAAYESLAAQYTLTEDEKVKVAKKSAEMRLDVLRDERQTSIALSMEAIDEYKAQRLDALDAVRQEAQFKVDTQQMTQGELLKLEQDLEQQRYEIVRQAVEARLEVLSKDPTKNVVALQKLNDELAQVEREHAMKMRTAQNASQKEQLKDWQTMFNSIGQSFGNIVVSLVTRTMTLGQAVKSLFQSMLSAVSGFLAQMIAKRLAAWAVEKAIGTQQQTSNAITAGSGAAASQASIPYVGPILALAAMAAVFAAVIGLGGGNKGGSTPSARNGFDIPAGMNPLTQLHEEEMVLPKEQADTIRNMDQSNAPIMISTTGGDFIHKNDLAQLLRKMNRNFQFVS